jgi:hypothetical protein
MTAVRIYADYNGLRQTGDGGLYIPLDTFGSLRDLSNAGVRLRDGLPLVVVDQSDDTEDLEAEAIAEFDTTTGVWLAVLTPAGYRYVPTRGASDDHRFLCLGCRRNLAADSDTQRNPGAVLLPAKRGSSCPSCGTPVRAALAPPESTSDVPSVDV